MLAEDLCLKDYVIFLDVIYLDSEKRGTSDPIDSLVCTVLPKAEDKENWIHYAEQNTMIVRVQADALIQKGSNICTVNTKHDAFNEIIWYSKERGVDPYESSYVLITYHREDAQPLRTLDWPQYALSSMFDKDYFEMILAHQPRRRKRHLIYLIFNTLAAVQESLAEGEAKRSLEESPELAQANSILRLEQAKLEEEREEIAEERRKLRQEQESFNKEKKKWCALGIEVANQDLTLTGLRLEENKLRFQIAGLKNEKESLKEQVTDMRQMLKAGAVENANIQTKITESSKEYEDIKERLQTERASLVEAEKDAKEKKSFLHRLSKQCTEGEKELVRLRDDIESKDKQLEETRRDLAKDKERLYHLQVRLTRQEKKLKRERIDLSVKLSSMHDDHCRSRESLHASRTQLQLPSITVSSSNISHIPEPDVLYGDRARRLGHHGGYAHRASSQFPSTVTMFHSAMSLAEPYAYTPGAGYCLAVSYDHKRNGNAFDVKRIDRFCQEMHLEVTHSRNETRKELEGRIREASDVFNNGECRYKYLLVIIMAHGDTCEGKDVFYATYPKQEWMQSQNDETHEYERIDLNEDVIRRFDSTMSAGLKGKPKLFFIQACRGREANAETDGLSRTTSKGQFPSVIDTLIWRASVEYNAAIRFPDRGSWFVQNALDEITERRGQCLYQAIHAVTQKACHDCHAITTVKDTKIEKKPSFPVPCVAHSTLRGDFYFTSKP